jgi:uncharacterized protein (TIGR03435 family)
MRQEMLEMVVSERHARLATGWVCVLLAGTLGVLASISPVMARAQAPAIVAPAHDAKNIEGTWQGTLQVPQRSLRLVLQVTKDPKGWAGKFYSIDQATPGINAAVALDGNAFKISIDLIGASFTGTLSADGNTLTGTWTQGPPTPLTMVRATKETAWEIPAPAPPPKLMPADANPSFDVATIKPNDTGATGMQGLTVNGRNFATRASSLADLISFAYQVQMKQVIGLPDWASKDRYDIAAVPDIDGAPSADQVRSMIRKLITERFKLQFHHDKRELSAFVLTVSKDGPKLPPTEIKGPLPGIGMRPSPTGLSMMIRNAAIADFTGFLQGLVLDRPVVDRTGLTARYDFTVTFTPDDSLFNGHPPQLPARTDSTEAAPGFFEALNKQAGLKLEPQKTMVDVLAIDHVEKPSAN